MTRAALKIALDYSWHLSKFANLREARTTMFARRDAALAALRQLADVHAIALELKPTNLRVLEAWYFSLYPRGFARVGTDRRAFEAMMNFHSLAIAKATRPKARWVVTPYGFGAGRYELGVEAENSTVGFGGCESLYKMPRNATHDSAYRLYCQLWNVPRERPRPEGNRKT
jgi:hypothetical protein